MESNPANDRVMNVRSDRLETIKLGSDGLGVAGGVGLEVFEDVSDSLVSTESNIDIVGNAYVVKEVVRLRLNYSLQVCRSFSHEISHHVLVTISGKRGCDEQLTA